MVKVRVEVSSDVIRITLLGHAGYSKKGEDIVCAGISGVIQFLAMYFFNTLHERGNFSFENGYGYIEVKNTKESKKLVDTFIEYVKLTSKSYPNTIDIET